jgi:hypothetical protein
MLGKKLQIFALKKLDPNTFTLSVFDLRNFDLKSFTL